MKTYILFGPPGAGKGTHAAALVERYNLKHISTGELLRAQIAAGTELGKQAAALIEKGNLVPDSVVEGMIENAFDTFTGVEGFLLDGFPRTMGQARDLDAILEKRGSKVQAVLSIMISDELVMERIKGRALKEGRKDDASEDVIRVRISTYHAQTEPLIDYYKAQGKYHEVMGDGTLEQNRARVISLYEQVSR